MTPGAYVSLYLQDNALVGSGTRSFLVLSIGRKWAKLLYIPLLQALTVPVEELDSARPAKVGRKLVARIKDEKRLRKRLGLSYSGSATRDAMALLGVPASP